MNDNPNIVFKNLSEDLVDMFLDDCMKQAGMCRCAYCRADVMAYALNHLPPHYVATRKGDIFVRLNSTSIQSQADILTAIMSGINVVKERPRHDTDA